MTGKRILIVDDEPETITFIRTILEDNGFEDIVEMTVFQGLDAVRKLRPDLILLDLILPHKGGIAIFQELRSDPALKHIPVIVVSGVSQLTGIDFRDSLHEKPFSGPDGFVEKPIDPGLLANAVKRILGKAV
jgi:CheY-like chemotaxis protein